MKLLDRILLVIYTLFVMTGLFFLGISAAGWVGPLERLQIALVHQSGRSVAGLLTLIFSVISLKFFLQGLMSEKRPVQAIVHEGELGQVRVSLEALENMVRRVCYQIKGVTEVKPRVSYTPEGTSIFVRVVLAPEINIPATSDEIQTRMKEYVMEVAGINVRSVKVLVDSISSETKPGILRKLN